MIGLVPNQSLHPTGRACGPVSLAIQRQLHKGWKRPFRSGDTMDMNADTNRQSRSQSSGQLEPMMKLWTFHPSALNLHDAERIDHTFGEYWNTDHIAEGIALSHRYRLVLPMLHQ